MSSEPVGRITDRCLSLHPVPTPLRAVFWRWRDEKKEEEIAVEAKPVLYFGLVDIQHADEHGVVSLRYQRVQPLIFQTPSPSLLPGDPPSGYGWLCDAQYDVETFDHFLGLEPDVGAFDPSTWMEQVQADIREILGAREARKQARERRA